MLTLASLALSTALSPNPSLSFYGTHWRQYGSLAQAAVVIFAWALSTGTGRTGIVLRAVSIAGGLTALYGIAQYLGWDPILPAAGYHIGEGIWTIVRPPSTFGYVSYFATWLLFVIFLSLALPGRLAKICAALALIAMLLTGTRAAFLGLAAGAVVWSFMQTGKARRAWMPGRRTVAIAAAALLVLIGFYLSPAGQLMRSRARWFAEDPWGGARPLLWRDSLRMGLARPLAGHGPETFRAIFPHYESVALARAYPDFAHESPHNIFLDALVGQGIAGVLLLGAWCALGFAAAWKIRAAHPQLAACLAAALAAGIVSQQFTVFTIPTAVIFFATIALAAGMAYDATPRRSAAFPSPCRCSTSRCASPSPITRWRWRNAISPPASWAAPPRITRRPARPATCGIRAPCSPPRKRRQTSAIAWKRFIVRPRPASAPPAPPKTRSTPGTASLPSVPRKTTLPPRSSACAPPLRPIPRGSNRTGPWPRC